MKKKISFSGKGSRADIGNMTIYRMLPNRYTDAVGPFVFLDHIAPTVHEVNATAKKAGTGAHPHRGIATLTYILNGEAEHFDSKGHHAKVGAGGIQWMKAGNGIIHDENLTPDAHDKDRLTHAFQFWINLPAQHKAEPPQYLAIRANGVPQQILNDSAGWIKVIAGGYDHLHSAIPDYSKQFIYHLHLEAGKQFSLDTEDGLEYAAFLPELGATINDSAFDAGEFIEFDRNGGTILIVNKNTVAMDIVLFGGEHYTEPIVAEGPFVMNSHLEIADAYKDFFAGKYGTINYG
ncbi:pirin family protein [Pseudoflavitalea sp. X16]|uniref:pirin family protein n=1 Tax=Paraflavitalea devenefica TaxID=2716334 RepID=UPI0014211C31|nr:pirin family protein [Paraflavitalea devenefica]NII28475.1 pirin family protein [Paraflavitalea devenefica]